MFCYALLFVFCCLCLFCWWLGLDDSFDDFWNLENYNNILLQRHTFQLLKPNVLHECGLSVKLCVNEGPVGDRTGSWPHEGDKP